MRGGRQAASILRIEKNLPLGKGLDYYPKNI
jgi:hypothetical protein